MNRKFLCCLVTLTALLVVYQLFLHGSTLNDNKHVSKQATQVLPKSRELNDTPVEAKLDIQGTRIYESVDLKDKVIKQRTPGQNNNLLIDNAPLTKEPMAEENKISENVKYQDPPKSITIHAKGRLGNHMFEYASLLGIAHMNNLTAFINGESKVTKSFSVTAPVYSYPGFATSFIEYAEKKGCVFEPEVMHLGSTSDILLKGYYQSWKYFDFYEKEIREQFKWNKTIAAASKHIFKSLIPPEQRSYVGIHVRRGDMKFKVGYREFGYVAADLDYIVRAMEYFRGKFKDVFFIVASDDYTWCKENIKGDDVRFVEQEIAEIDLAVLTLCNHTIMTVGSFGWWAAWLTNGETVYYKNYPRPGSQLDALFNADDYWLPSWIPM